jgi:hypothetical protein
MADNDLQQTLDRILGELQGNEPARCLSAIQELSSLNVSSKAIVSQLEKLALSDNPEVQSAALTALGFRTSQFIASRRTSHTQFYRNLILKEIDGWQQDGLIELGRAELLRRRYDFDMKPAAQTQPSESIAETVQQSTANSIDHAQIDQISQRSTAPRPSLMQTLLSESSIKVYLYLGAFFVIASALILAAVVEAARLPILVAATLAFGGGALVLHKRLPQPSFALFIVFSFLLPIDANVLEETIGIVEPALSVYWTFIFFLMAFIWGFSVWFYSSRFFSLVAFIALSLAFYRAGQIFDTELELTIFLGMLASLSGLAGTFALKKWKDNQFSLPVFLLAQVQAVGWLGVSVIFAIIHVFDGDISNGWWLLITLTWIAGASFFAASNLLFPFFLFPWMAVAALLPVPWFFLNAFDTPQAVYAIGFWFWGTIFALTSETIHRLKYEGLKKYHWAFLVGSLPLFGTAILIALDWDTSLLTFTLLAGIALVYVALHVVRPRWYLWSTALLAALFAYFVVFTLPLIEKLDVPLLYQLLGASVLLTVPELFTRTPLTKENQSRLPAIFLGLIVSLLTVMSAWDDVQHPGRSAIVFLTFAILLALHAFHFKRAWIGYFACAAEVLTVVYALQYFELDLWLPALTLLSVLYFATGFYLRRTYSEFKPRGTVFVNASLGLAAILSLVSVGLSKETAGWYVIVLAVLFAVDVFARPLVWLEVIFELLLSLALYMILDDFNPAYSLAHFLFGASLIWLGGDLLFSRFVEKRSHRPITLGIGYLLLVTSSVNLLATYNGITSIVYFALYAIFFAIYAYTQREPNLGYFVTAFIPLAVIKLYEFQDLEKWIFPLIILAVIYYAVGFALRRNGQAREWDTTLLYSGLGLGVLTSIAAPFQGGLDSSIPIAIAATLFAVEAFALRNVWWALPANALYLMSYFVILAELNVDEPQFYSIGAALLGMLMHYLLTRAGSKTSAFIMGMLSQLVLLGTTYIQMVSANELKFFFVLFAQSMVVLLYGLVQRSRSLVITPIAFVVLGVVTIVYSALKGLSSVILIGCTGVALLLLGIVAVILRERISKFGEQLSDWKP